jgi:hypothetical protein
MNPDSSVLPCVIFYGLVAGSENIQADQEKPTIHNQYGKDWFLADGFSNS